MEEDEAAEREHAAQVVAEKQQRDEEERKAQEKRERRANRAAKPLQKSKSMASISGIGGKNGAQTQKLPHTKSEGGLAAPQRKTLSNAPLAASSGAATLQATLKGVRGKDQTVRGDNEDGSQTESKSSISGSNGSESIDVLPGQKKADAKLFAKMKRGKMGSADPKTLLEKVSISVIDIS